MDSNDSETVTISRKEYDQLQKDTDMLNALETIARKIASLDKQRAKLLKTAEACGVDNWEGYSKAHKYLREQEEEQK